MKLDAPITSIMTSNVLFVHYNNEVREVEELMRNKKIRHVPVIKEGKVSGIVSLTDLQRLCFVNQYENGVDEDHLPAFDLLTLDQVMVTNPVTLNKDSSVKDAAEILTSNDFHALPVVDNEILMGIVTSTDLIKYLLKQEES